MTANGIRHRERYDNRGKILLREKKQWRIICVPSCFFSFFVLRGDEKESKPILSLYFIANALPCSIASRPTFDCVSSHVRSCLVPRSLKSIGTAGPTHYFRVFKIEYWQPRPRRRKLRWPACNRLLRRQHCSSLCSQSEGDEHVVNMVCTLAHDFVGFLAVFGRHNIRAPHFASKVSYSASRQTFTECSRCGSCCGAAAPERGSYSRIGACPYLSPQLINSRFCPCKGRISLAGLASQ